MEEKENSGNNGTAIESKLLPILYEGVQVVKLIAFQELKKSIIERYGHYGEQDSSMLAGALINEMFQTPNAGEKFLHFASERAADLEKELAALPSTLDKLRPLLADAIRIQFLCDSQEGNENPELLRIAQGLGILETDREVPMPAKFIHLVRIVGQSYGILAAP